MEEKLIYEKNFEKSRKIVDYVSKMEQNML